jgi:hypothetical protein
LLVQFNKWGKKIRLIKKISLIFVHLIYIKEDIL